MDNPTKVILKIQNEIAFVIMNEEKKLNALDLPMLKQLVLCAKKIQKNKKIRGVILTGEGSSFCAGLDIKSVVSRPLQTLLSLLKFGRKTNLFQQAAWCWRDLPVPVIAVISGHCLGGGLQIALGADFRISTPDCQFSIMEAKWGLIPDMSATATLREILPIDVIKELAMTAKIFNGIEAKQYGLVTHVDTNPLDKALELLQTIIERSPDSVVLCKRLFQQTRFASIRRAFALETWYQLRLLLGKNQRVAMNAQLKKGHATYHDRLS